MAEHPNAALVRPGWTAFAANESVDSLAALWADDARYHAPGRNTAFSGDKVGRNDIIAMLDGARPLVDVYEGHVVDVVASDNYAIAWVEVSVRKNDRTFDYRNLIIMRIQDSLIAEAWGTVTPEAESDEFWSWAKSLAEPSSAGSPSA